MMSLIKLAMVIFSVSHHGYCIITTINNYPTNPLNFIWNLTRYAVQSRQFDNNYHTDENSYFPSGNAQNVLNAMFSIAQNDDHLCIPKLLCEITAGTINYGRQSFLPEFNMDALLGILSTFEGISPIALFGRAALLGYNSKGNSYSCSTAYPKCPNDPDLLLNYLNNHNGGFFRFFNGLPNQENIETPGIVGFDGQHYGFVSRKSHAQKRILNGNKQFLFPLDDNNFYRGGRKLVFPIRGNEDNFLDIQKPLPNHVPSRTIFPIRTGTGSLVIDNFEDDQHRQNKGFVKFISN